MSARCDPHPARSRSTATHVKIAMITRIWHGRTPAAKSDEYLHLMRTIAIPDYAQLPATQAPTHSAASKATPRTSSWSRSGSPKTPSAPSPGTPLASRNTTTSTKISCSKWNRRQRITKCSIADVGRHDSSWAVPLMLEGTIFESCRTVDVGRARLQSCRTQRERKRL
jgi:hypothetical protein